MARVRVTIEGDETQKGIRDLPQILQSAGVNFSWEVIEDRVGETYRHRSEDGRNLLIIVRDFLLANGTAARRTTIEKHVASLGFRTSSGGSTVSRLVKDGWCEESRGLVSLVKTPTDADLRSIRKGKQRELPISPRS
jgi:hypothetical protein